MTRIEGHLKVEVVVENGKVIDAKMSGGMYRGFEGILKGRAPRDATQIVQRICGVCPTAHATASSQALEKAAGIKIPSNGRVTRNLILGANYLQSHILHFYHLAGQDFIQGPDTPPFVPRYKNPDLRLPPAINAVGVDQYLEALKVRAICHEMVALFAGLIPHVHGILAGGTTEMPTKAKLIEYMARFKKVRAFIEEKYLPVLYTVGSLYKDLLGFGQGHISAMSVGVFPLDDNGSAYVLPPGIYRDGKIKEFDPSLITEDVKYSWFDQSISGKKIGEVPNKVDVNKEGAYSFVKSPLYDGKPMEVGPLARMWIANPELSPIGQKMISDLFGLKPVKFQDLGESIAFSLLGRHIARAEETWHLLGYIEKWLVEVQVDKATFTDPIIPQDCEGFAFVEAPRGSLMHYTRVRNGVIEGYHIMPGTLWNAGPRNDVGTRGVLEEALVGVPVPDIGSPVNVARLIRAFDP